MNDELEQALAANPMTDEKARELLHQMVKEVYSRP